MLTAAAAGGVALASGDARAQARGKTASTELYEWRTYHLTNGAMRERLDIYLKNAFIPAARRAGCGPVGVFTVTIGSGSPGLQVLIPYPSIADFAALPGKLAADSTYMRAAGPFVDATPAEPPYAALDVKLMQSFRNFPRIAGPNVQNGSKGRIFELRTYHSHSEKAGETKIGMFDTGGEIDIFHRVGLTPVFFAQDLTGPTLPSLTYLLTFPDMAARDRSWSAFGADPDWRRLTTTPGLTDRDIPLEIDNHILRPTDYSQV